MSYERRHQITRWFNRFELKTGGTILIRMIYERQEWQRNMEF